MKLQSARSDNLSGKASAPGDKSISHRALILGGLATGRTEIRGLLEGEDVVRTAGAVRALGVDVRRDLIDGQAVWCIEPKSAWQSPDVPVYFGNSGTGVRLMMGAVAGQGINVVFQGDASLRSRPMKRVTGPLRKMGAIFSNDSDILPLSIEPASLTAVDYQSPVASAQVKSAVLLASIGCQGVTRFEEKIGTRDHTERMLKAFGVALDIEEMSDGGRIISIEGQQKLTGCAIDVPGDPSSASFLAAAAAICPGSDIKIENVLINPFRTGFFETLKEMGADIEETNVRNAQGELVADLRICYAPLIGVDVPASRAPSMIDEYPILAVVAAFASGETFMPGIEELRVKESDRIASVEKGLSANGVRFESGPDWLRVFGSGKGVEGGGMVVTNADHRIAMCFLVMGFAANNPITIDDASMIATSFPNFVEIMRQLGGSIDLEAG